MQTYSPRAVRALIDLLRAPVPGHVEATAHRLALSAVEIAPPLLLSGMSNGWVPGIDG